MINYIIADSVLEGVTYSGGLEDVVLDIPNSVKRIKKVRIYEANPKVVGPTFSVHFKIAFLFYQVIYFSIFYNRLLVFLSFYY